MSRPFVLVGATIAPYILSKPEAATAWLKALEDGAAGGVDHFTVAALECDGRGLEPYEDAGFLARLDSVGVFYEGYLGEGARTINTANRVQRIVDGLNLIRAMALRGAYSHVWYNHADTYAPRHALEKLLEVRWPIVGAHVPAYALDGPQAFRPEDFPGDVRVHMSPGASLLVDRWLTEQIPWRCDPVAGLTDDPAYHHDALRLGIPTLVRHDVVCRHYPEHLSPMENRFTEEARRWTT